MQVAHQESWGRAQAEREVGAAAEGEPANQLEAGHTSVYCSHPGDTQQVPADLPSSPGTQPLL